MKEKKCFERKITAKEWDTMVGLNVDLMDYNLELPTFPINTATMTTSVNDIIHDIYVPHVLQVTEDLSPKDRITFDTNFIEVISKYGERITYASDK